MELAAPVPFPDDPGPAVWTETRSLPVLAFYGVPALFLGGGAIVAGALVARLALGLAALGALALLVRARRRAEIERYALSARFLTVVQPAGGRVAVPVDALERVTLAGDRVRLEGPCGVVTLGFVRRQRALLRALAEVRPTLAVDRDLTAFCPT